MFSQKLKHAVNSGLASGYCGTEMPYETWPHYKDMDQILSKQEPLTHMLLSEPISNEGYDFNDEYPISAKRLER